MRRRRNRWNDDERPDDDTVLDFLAFEGLLPETQPRIRKPLPRSWREGWDLSRSVAARATEPAWQPGDEIHYVIDVGSTLGTGDLVLEVNFRRRGADGTLEFAKGSRLTFDDLHRLSDPLDREVLGILCGYRHEADRSWYRPRVQTPNVQGVYHPNGQLFVDLVPKLCRSGRAWCRVDDTAESLIPTPWDERGAWEFAMRVVPARKGNGYVLEGVLRRGDETVPLSKPVMVVPGGLAIFEGGAAGLVDHDAWPWMQFLRQSESAAIPEAERDEFLAQFLSGPAVVPLELPPELRYEETSGTPRPFLRIRAPSPAQWSLRGDLLADLAFDYEVATVRNGAPGGGFFIRDPRRRVLRDLSAETGAAEILLGTGARRRKRYEGPRTQFMLKSRLLPRLVPKLVAAGWKVEAEGKLYRQPGAFRMNVASGIDWFELHGAVAFEGQEASLPQILEALKKGEEWVTLDDGTVGMLPKEWLKKSGFLVGLGKASGDHVRFERSQVGLLDALLATQPAASVDAVFETARTALRNFDGVAASDPPPEFRGTLRPYQRDGLGWLHFLRDFGFGGCLADDMGLGKTVQVLALLESRRTLRETMSEGDTARPAPSVVVVPRSLIFNWIDEAARFTPRLRILDHTGSQRPRSAEAFANYDLVLTTYGTLRRDALLFSNAAFDYAILDEAQAVKNASTESAKAVRLLKARHRLAMSGTPVENHLGELWSLVEFLNPGMLGTAAAFGAAGVPATGRDEDALGLLARALRPFLLRRTKDQVVKELPQKLEQTLVCELDAPQRKSYDELREHYRRSLLGQVDTQGLGRTKIQVLEALLRLRQAAIHPGLIDRTRASESSAKLETLLEQLDEVVDGGHKALVFSQFTSMLAIVRDRIEARGLAFEYLDGKTRDRETRVRRFQDDPACKLFLISLKAGGLGLNLTAAEYVFILDPWWNPAVEAQAVDRTHRIGQTRPVFAYRLIARDTVEEKVLELQKTKRGLAEAIITANNSLIRDLQREDLDFLLS